MIPILGLTAQSYRCSLSKLGYTAQNESPAGYRGGAAALEGPDGGLRHWPAASGPELVEVGGEHADATGSGCDDDQQYSRYRGGAR
jgi:hypothetical protein